MSDCFSKSEYFQKPRITVIGSSQWQVFLISICNIIDFIVHVSSYFLHSTLNYSCCISFPSVHTSLIMFHFYFLQSTVHFIHFIYIVHLVQIYLIWLHSYYMVIQPYCQFHLSANPISGN